MAYHLFWNLCNCVPLKQPFPFKRYKTSKTFAYFKYSAYHPGPVRVTLVVRVPQVWNPWSSIQCWGLNPKPFGHEPSALTTWPCILAMFPFLSFQDFKGYIERDLRRETFTFTLYPIGPRYGISLFHLKQSLLYSFGADILVNHQWPPLNVITVYVIIRLMLSYLLGPGPFFYTSNNWIHLMSSNSSKNLVIVIRFHQKSAKISKTWCKIF